MSAARLLSKLQVEHPADSLVPVVYRLDTDGESLHEWLGRRVTLRATGRIICSACGNTTRKSYGGGHCYRCFKTLARCDLCVMAPQRCHYAAGTCREPQWGEDFCMQPHWVYLSNVTGLKVGITRRGLERGRWVDQGAVQGRLLARTKSRHAAGLLEVDIAQNVSDRGQWRQMVSTTPTPLDLNAAAQELAARYATQHPEAEFLAASEVQQITYPVTHWPPPNRLNFRQAPIHEGVLCGIKGQFLLFEHGVFNVREHTGYEAEISVSDDRDASSRGAKPRIQPQLELFK